MKKILSILETFFLIGINTINLISCNNTSNKYTSEELIILKEKNKIKLKNQEIIKNLEWISPQEKPFNKLDNKYYIIVARNSLNGDWKIFKLKNDGHIDGLKSEWGKRSVGWIRNNGIYLATGNLLDSSLEYVWGKNKKSENYIKSVYRWNNNTNIYDLIVNFKTGEVKIK